MLVQLGEPLAHLVDDDVADAPEVVEPDRPRLLDRAADDPAQDEAALLIRRITPSPTRNVIPRPWSARTRCALVAASESPYATSLSGATQAMIAW